MKLVLSAFSVLLLPLLLAVLFAAFIAKMFPIGGAALIVGILSTLLIEAGDRFSALQTPITLVVASVAVTSLILIIAALITGVRGK